MNRFQAVVRHELAGIHPRLALANFILAPLPPHVGKRLRPRVLRLMGLRIGRGTLMLATPTIVGPGDPFQLLTIGRDCSFNLEWMVDLGAPVTIGDSVAFGPRILLLTQTHDATSPFRRSGDLVAHGITIEHGVWVGGASVILPDVTIGAGSIVAAGAVVNRDVAPHTLVGGVPARPIRELDSAPARSAEPADRSNAAGRTAAGPAPEGAP